MVGGGNPHRAGSGGRKGPLVAIVAAATAAVLGIGGGVYWFTTQGGEESAGGGGGKGGGHTTAAPADEGVHTWLSGASSDEAADGQFGTWRGSPVQIGGTWVDNNTEMLAMRQICKGGAWASWNKPLDIAVGAIELKQGESWGQAAQGAYAQRWTASLTKLKQCWGKRNPSLLHIRFAHEANLKDSRWAVRTGEEDAFRKAIGIYSDLRRKILPAAQLVLCVNDETDNDLDPRRLWPGKDARGRQIVDIYSVDSYNQNPHVTDRGGFDEKISDRKSDGRPKGLETHRQFAEEQGVPFAVSEWSNNGEDGEAPEYVQNFHGWVADHAGDPENPRPGQIIYEIQFNLWGKFSFWPKTQQPETANFYRTLSWGTKT